jgi:glycosyltransferase involved in cell wall biosynthesis
MRVLYVEMAFGFGGSLTSLLPLFRNLPAEVEPILVSGFDARQYVTLPERVTYEQADIPPLPDEQTGALRQLGRFYRLNARPWMNHLAGMIERHRPDIIHTGNSAFSNASAALVGRRHGLPVIGYQKGFEYGGRPNRFVLRRGWYDHHIACSNAVAERLFELGLPRERCTVLYDGVAQPPEGFDSEPRTDDTPVIAMYSLLQAWKGQDVFLRAIAKVAERYDGPFRVVIAGDSPDRSPEFPAYLKALAAELGIADRVEFPGHVRNVYRMLAHVDIAVHASIEPEPFGTVVAEAMTAGVAVVATKGGGVAEYVHPEETGLQVPMGDVDALSAAIERLLREPELRRTLAQRGCEFARREFRPELYAEKVTAVYHNVLARAKGANKKSGG